MFKDNLDLVTSCSSFALISTIYRIQESAKLDQTIMMKIFEINYRTQVN